MYSVLFKKKVDCLNFDICHRREDLTSSIVVSQAIYKYNGCFFKFGVEVGVELSIVNALYRLWITDQLFTSYDLHEWCDLNRLSNAYFDAKF
jgi:hypothetical protein